MIEQKQRDSIINSIRIFTLGQFRIVSKNNYIFNTSGKSNKIWNLFKFLLINNNKGITPDNILECLCPEIDYADPLNTVQNMIYRLRKLLSGEEVFENSKNIILFIDGCYRLNLEDDIWIDFIEMEKSVHQAEIIKKEEPLQAIEYYRNAFDIYGGDLLPELNYEDWIVPQRIYYKNLYLKILSNLSKLYADQKLYDSIIQVCQKGLVIEPYEEEIHVQLIESLMNIGKIREAKEHYEKTASILEKEFGIKQTPEMQRIAQLLKSEYVQIKAGNNNISQFLMNEEEMNGAVFCDYRDFYTIYVLEKRKCERSGNALCPVYIEFENGKNIFKSNAHKNSAIKEFKKNLVNGLRKGDMVSLINKTQFVILLNNTEYQLVKLVIDRITRQYKANSAFKDIILEVEVCPSLPNPNIK